MRERQRAKNKFIVAPDEVFQKPLYFLAFGLGSGTIPFAPGTWGTLLAIPFYLLIRNWPLANYVIFVCCFVVISMLICDRVSREIKAHDHPGMNIDEFAGFFVTMIGAPHHWFYIVLGFCLFRIFDVIKPLGIRYIDTNVHGGFGMVLDDVVAGVYAALVLQGVKLVIG